MPRTLAALAGLGGDLEIVVADGGSTDGTLDGLPSRIRVVRVGRGRGVQQAAGAAVATGEVLWFLHADTVPPVTARAEIEAMLASERMVGGYFAVEFDGGGQAAQTVTRIYGILGRMGLCYGDCGIFVRRSAYEASGGFRALDLFEDLDLLRRLRRLGRMGRVATPLVTSSRRFAQRSLPSMLAQWAGLQILYWLGVSPNWLARRYALVREHSK